METSHDTATVHHLTCPRCSTAWECRCGLEPCIFLGNVCDDCRLDELETADGERTPLHGELQVTATVDDLTESAALPVGVDAIDCLLDAARHAVAWAEDLRELAEVWPTMTEEERRECIATGEGPDTVASDLLGAIDAFGLAVNGSAAEYAAR